ncbi:MAG: NAD-dependent epimerase/dehydratase family protein [Pseudomonadota bacterium]
MATTVFLTGINGFIGREIAIELINRGYKVRGSVRYIDEIDETHQLIIDATGAQSSDLSLVALELNNPSGWNEAMAGCSKLVHTAAPLFAKMPKNEQEAIAPSVNGTKTALKAAQSAGVDHVIVTSSITAISEGHSVGGADTFTEDDWSDLDAGTITPYAKAKTLGEREAWAFANAPDCAFALTTLLPGVTIGPMRAYAMPESLTMLSRLMLRFDPMLPNFGFPYVDVRDVARLHVDALETPATHGQRIALTNGFLWYADIAKIVDQHFPELNVIKRKAPSWFIRACAPFKRRLQAIVPNLDRYADVSNQKAQTTLGADFRPLEQSIIDTVESIIEFRPHNFENRLECGAKSTDFNA